MFTGPQSLVSIENFITEMRDRTWQLFQGRCIRVVSFLLLDLFHLQALVIPTLGLKWGNESTASVVPVVTYVEEASSREGKDPGSSDLHRVDGVKGESSQSPQHPDTCCPDLSLSRLPPAQPVINKNLWTDDKEPWEAAFKQYGKISNLVRNLVYQDGEGGDYSHFKGCDKTEIFFNWFKSFLECWRGNYQSGAKC